MQANSNTFLELETSINTARLFKYWWFESTFVKWPIFLSFWYAICNAGRKKFQEKLQNILLISSAFIHKILTFVFNILRFELYDSAFKLNIAFKRNWEIWLFFNSFSSFVATISNWIVTIEKIVKLSLIS